jgi:hypothetical protein
MAEEQFVVISNLKATGTSKDGYFWEKMKTKHGIKNKVCLQKGLPAEGTVVLVEAESEEEAAEAVAQAYGPAFVSGNFLVSKIANTKENKPH